MKKYLIIVTMCLILYGLYDYIVYYNGDFYLPKQTQVQHFTKAAEDKLWIDEGDGFKVFDMKGVNLGLGKPGKFATDYAITKEEYLRWFKQIQDLGANVIRVYTLAHEDFYEAFYEYNVNNPKPLYLLHGVWVDNYMLNSRRSAFDKEFYNTFLESCKNTVDVIHGRHKSKQLTNKLTQYYNKDISQWVYGYILGVEWGADIVAFTNETGEQLPQFAGDYLYTTDANNFEIFLAQIGDEIIGYESKKYGTQRALAFSNWSTTCPIDFPEKVKQLAHKYAEIDVEHIGTRETFVGGQFASYHTYPYYPEYTAFENETIENGYLDYLQRLNAHHQMPVVISEFGVPSSRGMASYEQNIKLGRNQGKMSEVEQGHALVSLYKDIIDSGSAGGIVFIWQDEWFKRAWNTQASVDFDHIPYWSDYQTNEQYFGLLSFDPGKEKSIVYVDGDKSEWDETDHVVTQGDFKLSMKYDEKFIYFLGEKDGFDLEKDKLYIPIDLTPKSGAKQSDQLGLRMSHNTDFIIEVSGRDQSRVWVQERYDTMRALYGANLIRGLKPFQTPPPKDSTVFKPISLILNELDLYNNEKEKISFSAFNMEDENFYTLSQSYETGKLTYGNANPEAEDFNSLADFCSGEGFVEIKLPWGLLNFSDPSTMRIHGDYYENYGVDNLGIHSMHVGIGDKKSQVQMSPFELKPLGRNPQYHERLKKSYYILQECWKEE